MGDQATLDAIRRGEDPRSIAERWDAPLAQFAELSAKCLLY
jgi:hypothetical protein